MKRRAESWPVPDRSRRRLLYVQPCSSFGGAERQASLNVPRLPRVRIRRAAAGRAVADDRALAQRQRRRRAGAHARVPGQRPEAPAAGRARGCRSSTCAPCTGSRSSIEALVRERRIDAIFAAMPFSWVAATPVARRLGVPIIWRAGGTEISHRREDDPGRVGGGEPARPAGLLRAGGARSLRAPGRRAGGRDQQRRRHRCLSPRRRRRAPLPARGRAAGRRLRGAPGAAEAPRGLPAHGGRDRAVSSRRALPDRRRGQPAAALRGDGGGVTGRRAGPLPRLRRGHAVVLRRVRHRGAAVAVRGVPQRRAREHGDAPRAGGVGRGRHARRRRATSARRWCSRSATSRRSRPPCAA